MIIPPKAVLRSKSKPILNLADREALDPEGVGFDLRLQNVFITTGRGSLLEDTRKTPAATELSPDVDGKFLLHPGKWYLATTVETMNLPINMAGVIFPRSTLFRSGVSLYSSVVPPGYEGPLTFGLSVAQAEGFEIAKNARFCHLVLMSVRKGATTYRGQWNQGRISADVEEKQV